MTLNKNAQKLINLLFENSYEAYAVGGCVRDMLLQREVSDIDITTSARPGEVEEVLKRNNIKYFETGIKHGTVTAVLENENFEITTYRVDGKYLDNRHPSSVKFVSSLREDLSRRDFTMNALAFNERDGIVDIFGGKNDIENKIIRAVGDPEKRFKEDALRIMRALRFSAVLGFKIEEKTKSALFKLKDLLLNVAYERLFAELKKLIVGDFAGDVLLEYRDVFAVIIPELKPCFDFPQNSKWHIYDVYTHIVKAVCLAPKKDYLRLALLFHDIGKPDCKTTDENGQDHFKGHPAVSAMYTKNILDRFKASNDEKKKIITLVEIHDLDTSPKKSGIKKWMRALGRDMFLDYLEVRRADMLAHNTSVMKEEIETFDKIRKTTLEIIENNEPYRISDLKINGNDLLNIGFCGKEIKDELERLISQVSSSPELNTKERLLSLAENDYKKLKKPLPPPEGV